MIASLPAASSPSLLRLLLLLLFLFLLFPLLSLVPLDFSARTAGITIVLILQATERLEHSLGPRATLLGYVWESFW